MYWLASASTVSSSSSSFWPAGTMIFFVMTMAAGSDMAILRLRLPRRFQPRFSASLTWSRLAMLPSVTVSLGSGSMAYRSSRYVPLPVCDSSISLIEVEAISTPISDGDFVLKKSSAEESFSATMALGQARC